MISGQRVVSVDPEVVIIAGLNDQLHSRRMLNAFIDRLIPCSELIGEVIKTLLYAMLEAEKSIGECFARQLVKDLRTIYPLCLAARTPAVCICDGRLVR